MSEVEKNDTIQSSNDHTEADEITNQLDSVAGGVLGLQQVEGGEEENGGATSFLSVGCVCLEEVVGYS